jgi:two-component system response regulator FixJ
MDAQTSHTVYVVDDDDAVRDAIGMLLNSAGMTVRTFPGGEEFIESYSIADIGCLVLDMRMPGMSGFEVLDRLQEMQAPIPVVFVTGHGDIPMAVEAMRRGAVNFIRKPFGDEELLACVNEALDEDWQRRQQKQSLDKMRELVALLTPREHEVFQRVAAGQANKVIAIELGISERTVEIHRSQVMHKTNSRSLADLVRLNIALDQGVSL